MAKTYQMNAFTRFGNTMSAAMIRLGIGPAGLHLLRVKGRKTGLPRITPVNLIEHQGCRWLVAPYGEVAWVRNARAAGQAELLRGHAVERTQLRKPPPKKRSRYCAPTCGSSSSSCARTST